MFGLDLNTGFDAVIVCVSYTSFGEGREGIQKKKIQEKEPDNEQKKSVLSPFPCQHLHVQGVDKS